jgi:predicted Zn-dependent peptidase
MLMRSGGAGGKSPAEFDSALDNLGAKLSSSIGHEMGNARLQVLSGDLQEGLGLMFDMLMKPAFDERRLAVAKQKVLESLRRQDDDPGTLASYRFKQMVYGKESPWARRPDGKSLAGIDRKDIEAFHKRYFKTDNMILTAAGDFEEKELIAAVQNLTAGAPKGKIVFPKVEPVKLEFGNEFEGIARPLTQSFIRMGHLSIKRHNPEKFALFLADDILGASGFMSRLVKDVRAKRGLAYAIWSTVSIGTDYGIFSVGVNTKASNAERVIGMVEEHLERIAVKGDITKEELDLAKKSILARLIFQFDSPFKVVNQQARFHFYGYPEDYWRIYRDRIAATTLKEVKAAAKKYLKPEDLEIMIVGPKSSFPKGQVGER